MEKSVQLQSTPRTDSRRKSRQDKKKTKRVNAYNAWDDLTDCGQLLLDRCGTNMNDSDLQEAIEYFQNGASISSHGAGDIIYTYQSLGVALETRFEQRGDPVDLDNAIINFRRGLELSSHDRPEHLRYLARHRAGNGAYRLR